RWRSCADSSSPSRTTTGPSSSTNRSNSWKKAASPRSPGVFATSSRPVDRPPLTRHGRHRPHHSNGAGHRITGRDGYGVDQGGTNVLLGDLCAESCPSRTWNGLPDTRGDSCSPPRPTAPLSTHTPPPSGWTRTHVYSSTTLRNIRLIVTGGGTGGHSYPALTTVNALQRLLERAGHSLDVLWVGAEDGLEARIAAENDIAFESVAVGKVRRAANPIKMLSRENVRDMANVPRGVAQARSLISEFAPDVVLATGGYVAVPVG